MAHIHEARNDLKIKYEKVRYTSSFDRFLHSPGGNRLCLILAAAAIPLFFFFVFNPQIPLELRNDIPLYVTKILEGPLSFLQSLIGDSLLMLLVAVVVVYLLVRNYFMDFSGFILFALAVPFLFVIFLTFFQSVVHISVYAFPVLQVIFAWAVRYETKHTTRIVTPDSNEGRKIKVGLDGERKALDALRYLDDCCHIYTNLRIPYGGGESETDLVLCTPSGVTIVEVKNYVGTLSSDISHEQLIHNGQEIYNPVTQVKKHKWRMSGFLHQQGIRIPVQRCVFFVNPKTRLELTDCNGIIRECPIFTHRDRNALAAYADGKIRCTEDAFFRTVEALDALVEDSYR